LIKNSTLGSLHSVDYYLGTLGPNSDPEDNTLNRQAFQSIGVNVLCRPGASDGKRPSTAAGNRLKLGCRFRNLMVNRQLRKPSVNERSGSLDRLRFRMGRARHHQYDVAADGSLIKKSLKKARRGGECVGRRPESTVMGSQSTLSGIQSALMWRCRSAAGVELLQLCDTAQ